jgi:protein-tyrosine phosphatase
LVINCTQDIPNFHEPKLRYLKCPLEDHPQADISQFFDPVYYFVLLNLPNEKNILIHCAFGISRSASIAISLIMRFGHLTRMQAQSIIEIRRPEISPNHGFVQKLIAY